MKSLDQIAIEHQTDKASVFTRTYAKPKDYCRHYDALFTTLRDQPIKLLEIGVGGGESIRAWLEYFQSADVRGVDLQSNTNTWDTPGRYGRYFFNQGDQSSAVFWKCWLADHGTPDIVIDDGSHVSSHIITTFNELWPALKPGGFYAIEDLGVSYGDGSFVPSGSPNHMDWLRGKVDMLNLTGEIDSIYFAKELAVLRKAL